MSYLGEADQLNRDQLLAHLQGDHERMLGARAFDWAEQVMTSEETLATPFLDPAEQQIVSSVLRRINAISFRSVGGYKKAERHVYLIYPHYALIDSMESPISVVEINVRDHTPPIDVSHRDVLGTLTGLGLSRDQIGDIIMTPTGAQAILTTKALTVVTGQLDRVSNVSVSVREIDFEQISGAYDTVKQIKSTVASLRLDAIASLGFGDSRTKMSREIKNQRLKLNWLPVKDPAKEVNPGDVISMRGRGRVTFKEVTGKSRKGRIGVILERYL